ncbi:MAG: GFA family protein [Burkholderiales bacterium]|nr:GFA family protein [Burkholderiales bacterium]
MVVHACHCRWCQRETGSAFVINGMWERPRLRLLAGRSEAVLTPSESGFGHSIHRCPSCKVALWSHYGGAGPLLAFVRVGTLDEPDRCPPDVHIFTASKQPWLTLPPEAKSFAAYYDSPEGLWPAQGVARRAALRPAIEAWQAERQAMQVIDP